MSVLAPLYLLGLAAISLPLVFHLIRRTPRREQRFSSLMFLEPSPPRITRRSRLDNLLLLLLRALAITLLAAAFARPFFRQSALAAPDEAVGERVAVLVDTSASMQRGDLWRQAVEAVDRTLGRYRPQDRFAVFAFDQTLRPVVGYDDLAQVPPQQRRAAALAQLRELGPTSAATNLGLALGDVLADLEDASGPDAQQSSGQRRVVLISDMQQGGRLTNFSQYDWPDEAVLELVPLSIAKTTNAGLTLLGQQSPDVELSEEKLRVRVSNAADSTGDSFRLQWRDAKNAPLGDPTDVYTPSGESRVARVALPPASGAAARLTLTGDDFDFDNTIYHVRPSVDQVRVLYLGDDQVSDAEGSAYYVASALESNASRAAVLDHRSPGGESLTDGEPPQLVVVTAAPTNTQCSEIRDYLRAGGTALYVLQGGDGDALGLIVGGDPIEVGDADVDDYVLLEEIDFKHPLFAPMAGPQFNNFTQIHFWKHRQLSEAALPDASVLARFDSGSPAILEQQVGEGSLVVFTSGWQPSESQLARSWKFLLILSTLIDQGRGDNVFGQSYLVGERAPLPSGIELAENAFFTKPDGSRIAIEADADAIGDTNLPGIYTVATTDGPAMFSVHIDPLESETAPLPQEAFEQVGCRLAGRFDPAAAQEDLQQLRDVELEGRQKVWKYLIAAALALLVVETLIAGRLSHPPAHQSAPA